METLSTTFLPGTTTQVQIGTYRVTSSVAKYYGATTLDPEKATNLSAGIVLTPIEDLVVTLDASGRNGTAEWERVPVADRGSAGDPNYVNNVEAQADF